jgi:predicted RNA-binding protein YlxR (DUF448 family)/ribosomal protein L7Ae-like RNA K-turn-binding protein
MSARDEIARTCVGCRQRDDRGALLRFVVAGDPPQAVPDVSRRATGRGASVHPRRRCIDAAVRSGALRRALRAELVTNADELVLWASGQYGRRVDGLLTAAYRSGAAVIGTERVRDVIAAKRAAVLVVAGDATENRQELMRAAERLGGSCLVHGDKASLGRLFGRETVAVVAIVDRDIATELQNAARCAAEIAGGAGEGTREERPEGS